MFSTTSAHEVIGDCFKDLHQFLPSDIQPRAEEYLQFIKCLDKATRHAIGEAANIYVNTLMKKREAVLNLTKKGVPEDTRANLLFAPVSDLKIFPVDNMKDTAASFRQTAETTALANVISAIPPARSFFRGSHYSGYYPSQLQSFRGRGQGTQRKGFGNRGMSGFQRWSFNRRDNYLRGARKRQRRQRQRQ